MVTDCDNDFLSDNSELLSEFLLVSASMEKVLWYWKPCKCLVNFNN